MYIHTTITKEVRCQFESIPGVCFITGTFSPGDRDNPVLLQLRHPSWDKAFDLPLNEFATTAEKYIKNIHENDRLFINAFSDSALSEIHGVLVAIMESMEKTKFKQGE